MRLKDPEFVCKNTSPNTFKYFQFLYYTFYYNKVRFLAGIRFFVIINILNADKTCEDD